MTTALELLLACVLYLVVPSVGSLVAVLALSRPRFEVFTTPQTEQNLFGDERYRFPLAVDGFGLAGLVDDLAGDGRARPGE